jgi:hypothetical protein
LHGTVRVPLHIPGVSCVIIIARRDNSSANN